MKRFYLIFGLITIMLFINISDIKAIDVEDSISVDSLPTCDSTTANNVYALSTDNHYHKCNEVGGGLRNIRVGDNLYNKVIYFNFPSDLYLHVLNTTKDRFISAKGTRGFYCYRYIYNNNVDFDVYVIQNGNTENVTYSVYGYSSPNNSVYKNLTERTFYWKFDTSSSDFNVLSIDVNNPCYQYLKILADISYSYEDLGEITEHIYFTHTDKDFYLFYDFSKISTFDIFSFYDFTTFTDFQRLVIVLGVNTFYLGFLGFCVYVVIKLIYKLSSWLF